MATIAPKLTARQRLFVDHYLETLNASESARRAGYSPDTAGTIASENLQKPSIQAAIMAAMQERAERLQVSQDDVIRELMRVAFSDITNYSTNDAGALTTVEGAPSGATRAVASHKFVATREPNSDRVVERAEFRLWDKLKALELLGKHLGMFRENIDLNVFGHMSPEQLHEEARRRGIDAPKRPVLESGEDGHA